MRLLPERASKLQNDRVRWHFMPSISVLLDANWSTPLGIEVFNGVVLRPTPRAVAERGGPTLAFTRPGQARPRLWKLLPNILTQGIFNLRELCIFSLSSDNMKQEVPSLSFWLCCQTWNIFISPRVFTFGALADLVGRGLLWSLWCIWARQMTLDPTKSTSKLSQKTSKDKIHHYLRPPYLDN